MAGGLFALLDDVALIARSAASSVDDVAALAGKTSMKAAGVVVDDAAVTPQYVQGVKPQRELPMIWRITKGSLINKLVIILPIALILSWIAPWALTPILMCGGAYLCFEGAEKIWELITGHHGEEAAVTGGPGAEKKIISGAVRTDLILSAEIMVISLNEVADAPLLQRAAILLVVGIAMTLLVYGAVGLLVKMDDVGLSMAKRDSPAAQRTGLALVSAMPKIMTVISYVGMIAMLWVGGHIVLVGLDELGSHYPYVWVHHLEEALHGVAGVGGALAWLVGTIASTILGAIWGAIILAVVHVLPFGKKEHASGHSDGHADADAPAGETASGAPVTGPATGAGPAAGGSHRADPPR